MSSTALPTSTSTSSTTLSTSSTNSSTISLTPTPSPSSNFTPYSDSPITPCGKCVTCNKGFLNTDPEYFNKITGEKFVVTDEMNCKSTNIVYLIRCAHPNCPMQYIGQSINSLNTRCIGHRSGILRGVNEPKFILDHFKNTHNPSDLRITPLVREDMSGILILWDFHIRSSLTSGITSLKVKLKYFHRCQFLFSP